MSEQLFTTGVAAGGDGIARLGDGRVVLVEGALPGEHVEARVTAQRPDYARARVSVVLVPSALRIAAPCPTAASGCGGCQWQHVSADGQLQLKAAIVSDALGRIAHLAAPEGARPVAVPRDGYRTTVRLGVMADGSLGYRRRHRHELVAVDTCLVAHPRLAEIIRSSRFPGAQEVLLRVGVAGGEQVAMVRGDHRKVASASVPVGVVVTGGEHPGPSARVHESVAGRLWQISGDSFFQSGPAAAELLVASVDAAVGEALGAEGCLVDAYAGAGILGGTVAARRQARLVAIEQRRATAQDATANLADLEGRVVQASVGGWRPAPDERVDVVIADPARPGLGRPGVSALVAAGAPRLVLVSCDPASLGRDARLLAEAGYRLSWLQVLDLLPGTVHVEAVARFDR